MRKVNEVIPHMQEMGRVLAKYNMVEKRAFDFGIGLDLYPSEIHTLAAIDRLGGCGVTALAQESGVTKGAISQLVSKLVKKGLIVKEPDPENGAKVILKLTGAGKKASDNHYDFHLNHDSEFIDYLRAMSQEELQMFDEICSKMNEWMDNYLK
ncbi:MarR family winged helix-turn-helix transcriptional regulator [Maridesulfovibrio sp.]|uniref:MarR family winged helix-turn-helix transcriptional regulator n=1 Tax=Maridesulfovibrio sp. TaxID=2795000 RepID=UPI0029CA5947|nr:MarR family winged helix-turn-helix transcriptional regulator [Maridesulfovibrio sp.]